jgi:mRNA interferase RelE/StbE
VKYEVEISESAEKSLEKIPKKDRLKILENIDTLEQDPIPAGSVKLKGYKEALYRIRSGDYRVIYSIKHSVLIILIVEVGHRREIYR